MKKAILFWIGGGLLLTPAGAANAQAQAGSAGPAVNVDGTVSDSRSIMAANRERDAAYNTLSARGVRTTDKDRENSRGKRPSAVPATAADITAGAQVRDIKGVPIGTIATLASNEIVADPSQTVIDTGHGKIGVPLSGFGKDDKGLVLNLTAAKFNELVAQVHAQAPEPPTK